MLQLQVWAFLLLQEASPIGWDPRSLWAQMGVPAKLVVILLFLMSAWSIGVMIDRLLAYSAETIACVCAGRGRRFEGRQAGRGH